MYEARNITQRYGNFTALQDVSITIRPGEVHALLGANGAGKSTLMKTLAGAQRATEGVLTLDGQPVTFADTSAATDQGIAWVAQELTVFPQLDVLENLFLTREPRRGPVISRREMRRRAAPFLRMVGLDEELGGQLGLLRLGERQRVEICRALLREPRILILDEPTSAWTQERRGGCSMLFADSATRVWALCWFRISWKTSSPSRTPSLCSAMAAPSSTPPPASS